MISQPELSGKPGQAPFDPLGRQTLIPAVDTPAGLDSSDLSIGYYDTDAARTLSQSGTTTTYQLDAAGRRGASTTDTTASSSTTKRHYDDSSDNPAWAETTTSGQTVTSRYLTSIDGDLAVTLTDGAISLSIADMHGDISTSLTIDAGGVRANPWSGYDEYGNYDNFTTEAENDSANYAWLGAKGRATDDSGITLMGARLYNPVTGAFTSVDPVRGGNTTAYVYPQDPINKYDLDGRKFTWGWLKKGASLFWKHRDSIALGLGVLGMLGCVACGLASMAITAASTAVACRYGQGLDCALGVASLASGGVGAKLASRGAKLIAAGERRINGAVARRGLSRYVHRTYGQHQMRVGARYNRWGKRVGWGSVGVSAYSAYRTARSGG